ncbi:MAG TPA: DUF3108 domain-containing protein [Xanthomonadaceae bacterium]|jgi:hypothetical protein
MNILRAKILLTALPCLLAIAGATLAEAASAADLKPYTATYNLSRNGDIVGTTMLTLTPTPGGWQYQSFDKGTRGTAAWIAAKVEEESQIARSGGSIEMRSYNYRLSTVATHKHQTIVANPATHSVSVQGDKHDYSYPMQPGVVDKLSLTVAIAQDLANGKRGTLSYPVAGRDHIDAQQYQVGAEQKVNVPVGSQRAIMVSRVLDASAKGKSTTYWFGLDNGFVPVRIVHSDKDGTEELQLASLAH